MLRTALYTSLAVVAFAANSVLCRLALGDTAIDPASFTTVRIASGAAALLLASAVSSRSRPRTGAGGNWLSAALLAMYAVPFAFAYVTLTTGMGALILFGCVQGTMMIAALRSGERPTVPEWLGLAAALAGLVYLVSPGLSAPDPLGSLLMGLAGVAWGQYSIRGRRARDPIQATTGNFVRAVPFVMLSSAALWPHLSVSARGVGLALLSGAVTSGLGYVVWYRALRDLSTTRAAIVQLPVPLLTALGGLFVLSETLSVRLLVSAALIIGGVGLAIAGRTRVRDVRSPAHAGQGPDQESRRSRPRRT